MPTVLTLPEGTRLIHIGPPKTGTTALQQAMHQARNELARHGVHYAGATPRASEAGRELVVEAPGRPDHPLEKWGALAREVEAAGTSRVCVSNEGLAAADDDRAARVVRDLGGSRAHVVMCVRRLDKLLPSQWQQRIRRRPGTPAYDEWLAAVLGDRTEDPHWRHFWSHHDVQAARNRWAAAADADRVTFIVLDESERVFLPRTFEQLLGLPEGLLSSAAQASNRSLTPSEAELVLALNQIAHEHGWTPAEFHDVIRPVTATLRRRQPSADARIAPPSWAVERIRELTDERYELVRSCGVRVLGDPESLQWRPDPGDGIGSGRTAPLEKETAGELLGVVADVLLERIRSADQRAQLVADQLAQAKATRARSASRGRSVSEVSGRELLGLAARRLGRRLRPGR